MFRNVMPWWREAISFIDPDVANAIEDKENRFAGND